MRFLTAAEIKEQGTGLAKEFRRWAAEDGFDDALKNISRAIEEIQQEYPKLRFEIFANASEPAFSAFGNGSRTVPISGIVHIGHEQRLFALATRVNNEKCLKICLSKYAITFQESTPTVAAIIYDLKNYPEALVDFQKEIINHCARSHVIMENDVANAFEKPPEKDAVKPVIFRKPQQ